MSPAPFVYERVTLAELPLDPGGAGCVVRTFEEPVTIVGLAIPESCADVIITGMHVEQRARPCTARASSESEALVLSFAESDFRKSGRITLVEVDVQPGELVRLDLRNLQPRHVRVRPLMLVRRGRSGEA